MNGTVTESPKKKVVGSGGLVSMLFGLFPTSRCCNCLCLADEEQKPFWTRDGEIETPTTSVQDYTNDAFETESVQTTEAISASKKTSGSPTKEIATISNGKVITRPPKSPLRKNSESESEDSFSLPYSAGTENISDQSDVEGRIRALTEELKRKKAEADQIKREEKKKQKQRLKEQETSLKNQIEVYEKYIDQLKDPKLENQENKASQNVPKIKQPSENRLLGKSSEPVTSPGKAVPLSAIELSIADDSNASLVQDNSLSSEVSVKHKISSSTPSKRTSLKDSSIELDLTPVHSVHTSKSSSSSQQHSRSESQPQSVEKRSITAAISAEDDDDIKEDSVLEQSTDKSSVALLDIKKDSSKDIAQDVTRESKDKSESESKDKSESETKDKSESRLDKQTSKTDSISESIVESNIPETHSRTDNESAKADTANQIKDSVAAGSSVNDVSKEVASQKSVVRVSEKDETSLRSKSDTGEKDKTQIDRDSEKQDVTSEASEQEPSLSQRSEESFHYSSGPSSQKSYTEFSSQSQSSHTDHSQESETLSKPKSSENVADSIHSDIEHEISDHVSVERSEFSDSPQLKLDLGTLKDADSEDETEKEKEKEDEEKDKKEEEEKKAKEMEDIIDTPRMTEDLDLEKIGEEMDDPLSQFSVGDRVLVGGLEAGTLKFIGSTSFAEGFWGGVELDRPEGTCDGSQQGVRYFTCQDNYGIFAPPEKLQFLDSEGEQRSLRDEESLPDSKQGQTETEESVKDAESSIAEDVSISSELERAITSAAAAVEEFGSMPGQEECQDSKEVVETVELEEKKDVESDEEEEKQKEEVKKQAMESLVDTVTDSILQKVTKAKVDGNGQDLTPLDVATRNLLNDSISQMMDIYHRRKSSSEEEPQIIETASPVISEEFEFAKTSDNEEDWDLEHEEHDDRWAGDLGEKVKVAREDDLLPQVPSSFPEFSAGLSAEKDDLALMYHELEALTGEEWMDDDFGLGIQPKAPPPYPENRGRTDITAALANLAKEPLFFIPRKKEEIENVVKSCVDLFWERRRYGEPWDDFSAPPELFESGETNDDMEGKSKHAFKSFVFDLTGDILRDTYNEENVDGDDDFVWQKTRRLVKRKFYRGGVPPLTVDEVRPIVEHNVLKMLGHTQEPASTSRFNKWSSRKKRDHVDKVLLKELKEDEPDWVNYAEDELTVKYQIADSIFDSLLIETAQVMTDIVASKNGESEC